MLIILIHFLGASKRLILWERFGEVPSCVLGAPNHVWMRVFFMGESFWNELEAMLQCFLKSDSCYSFKRLVFFTFLYLQVSRHSVVKVSCVHKDIAIKVTVSAFVCQGQGRVLTLIRCRTSQSNMVVSLCGLMVDHSSFKALAIALMAANSRLPHLCRK